MMSDLADKILSATSHDEPEVLLQAFDFGTDKQNQLLFFWKPECFLHETRGPQEAIVDLVADQFVAFDVEIAGLAVLSGSRLADLGTMDRHYGFINKMSKSASTLMSLAEKAAVRERSNAPFDCRVLGGHEILAERSDFSPNSLEAFWARKPSQRLRSGLYFERYDLAGEPVVIVNGFHPEQLAHFTRRDRRTVLALVHSDLPWAVLRRRMLGDGFPEKALPGSIRRRVYEDAARFGFASVTIANNCCHMSAGPYEALFELDNFLGSATSMGFSLAASRIASLARPCGPDRLRDLLANPVSRIGGVEVSLFDATEELDTVSSVFLAREFWTDG